MADWKPTTDKDGNRITLESSESKWQHTKNEAGGRVTPSPYTTFTIMDSKGMPHKISGKDEADAYHQAIASGITPGASTSKKRNRIVEAFGFGPDSFGAKLGPEKTRAVLETGDWSLVDAAKDAFTLPQRALAGAFGGDMGKTSDEYASEGKTLKSIATSPLIVPNVLAGVSTGGLSLPAQIATTGAVGVGSGLAFDDNYGGGDIALDVGLNALPALGPILSRLPKNASLKTIKGALSKAGVPSTKIDEIASIVSKKGYKEVDKLADDYISQGAKQISSDLSPAYIDMDLLDPAMIEMSASSTPIPRYAPPEKQFKVVDTPMRSLEEVNAVKSVLPQVTAKVENLNRLLEAGALEKPTYQKHVTDLLRDYGHIPEVRDVLTDAVSKQSQDMTDILTKAHSSAGIDRPLPEILDYLHVTTVPKGDVAVLKGFEDLKLGESLKKVKKPTTSKYTGLGIGDISLGTLRKIGQKAFTQPSPLLANIEEGALKYGAMGAPSYFTSFRYED